MFTSCHQQHGRSGPLALWEIAGARVTSYPRGRGDGPFHSSRCEVQRLLHVPVGAGPQPPEYVKQLYARSSLQR